MATATKTALDTLIENNIDKSPRELLDIVLHETERVRKQAEIEALEAREQAEVLLGDDCTLRPKNMAGMWRMAKLMVQSSLLPEHLRMVGTKGNKQPLPFNTVVANCFRIVNQAVRWGCDPFALPDETYVVGGKLGYQGKLIAAIVNARAGLEKRLDYEFKGEGQQLTVIVSGVMKGETKARVVELKLADAITDNQMWRKDPQQKLIYSGVTKWARRHCPEIVLGILSDDDVDRMNARMGDAPDLAPARTLNGLTDRLNGSNGTNGHHANGDDDSEAPAAHNVEEADTGLEPGERVTASGEIVNSEVQTETAPAAATATAAKPADTLPETQEQWEAAIKEQPNVGRTLTLQGKYHELHPGEENAKLRSDFEAKCREHNAVLRSQKSSKL